MKKLALALGLVGLSASAYAAHVAEDMLPVAPPVVNVTIPQQVGSWAIGLEALYYSAANGDFRYAHTRDVSTSTSVADEGMYRVKTVDPEHEWGGHVDLTYNFEGNGRYVKVAWTHLDSSESDSVAPASNSQDLFGPLTFSVSSVISATATPDSALLRPDSDDTYDLARGKSSNDYDHIDLVFGQRMDFGQKVTLAAFGGLRYANLEHRDSGTYSVSNITIGTTANLNVTDSLRYKSDFKGVGPRGGFDAQVRLGGGVSIVGTFAGSLLTGDADQKFDFSRNVTTTAGVASPDNEAMIEARVSDSYRVIPELDSRIGVNYTASFSPDMAFGVEVGYEAINYFDAKDNSAVSYFDTMGHDNDFGLYGPYIRVQFEMA